MNKIKKTDAEWRAVLDEESFKVTRKHGTERAFTGKYHDHKGDGLYHCICCGHELFDSKTKFDSGTGWPSYYDICQNGNVVTKEDRSFFMRRVEVLCGHCDAHLGHVFDDGPAPTHKRYCINSAALDFKARDSKE